MTGTPGRTGWALVTAGSQVRDVTVKKAEQSAEN
jgi:hypothetical protein